MADSPKKTAKRRRMEEMSPVKVGDVVADKYVIEDLLAIGGMGLVATARHQTLGQRVALKFLLTRSSGDEAATRFLREARAAAGLKSDHVVRVYDCGVTDEGTPFLAMEHLDGVELSKQMRRGARLAVHESVDLVVGAIEGVAEAHAAGIVHRDLKPSNLFLVRRSGLAPQVKVLDFGISKIQPGPDQPVDDELTETSAMLGSPRYMAPEQAKNPRDVDVRADVWSLGVILYQLLDGASPFGGDTFGEVLSKVLLHDPIPLNERHPDVPVELAKVVSRCLQRDRQKRFRDVGELALALAPFGGRAAQMHAERVTAILADAGADGDGGGGGEASGSGIVDDASEAPTMLTPSSEQALRGSTDAAVPNVTAGSWEASGRAAPRSRARRGWWAGGVIASLALGGILAAVWVIGSAPRSPESVGEPPPGSNAKAAGSVSEPPSTQAPIEAASVTTAEVVTTAAPAASASSSASASPPPATTPTRTVPPRPTGGPIATPPATKTRPADVLDQSD